MERKLVMPEEVGFSTKCLERIRPALQGYVDRKEIAGLSTMVARQGKIVHCEQVGYMDWETKRPMLDDAIFRIYSMTKPVICVALMTLYEEGRFQLFDPISNFIPAFGTVKALEKDIAGNAVEAKLARPITIRDLLTHTAGLTYDWLEDSPVGELYREARLANDTDRTLEEMIRELTRLPLAFQPGARWHYSLAIDVIAHLVEVLSDIDLGSFLFERIFSPLGMEDTAFCVPDEKQDRCPAVYGYGDPCARGMAFGKVLEAWAKQDNSLRDLSSTYPMSKPGVFARGGHGLFSTLWDYARFAQMLLNGGELDGARILGRKTAELMHMNHLPDALRPFNIANLVYWHGYGFGLGSRVLLNVAESQMPGSVGEFGWPGVAKTYFWVDPKEEIIGLLMAQYLFGIDLPEKTFQVLTYQAIAD